MRSLGLRFIFANFSGLKIGILTIKWKNCNISLKKETNPNNVPSWNYRLGNLIWVILGYHRDV